MVAAITLNPTHAKVGTSVLISGTGFTPLATPVSFTYGGSSIVPTDGPISVAGDGTFAAHITIPASVQGVHVVNADDGTLNANANFTVDSFLSVAPLNGIVGSSAVITATGLATNSALTVDFAGTDVTPAGSPTSDVNGSYSGTIVIPAKPKGARTITLTDASANAPTASFTVNPNIVIDPTYGPEGAEIVITGSGFAATSAITFKVNGSVVPPVTPVTSASDGTFTGTLNLPSSLSSGSTTILATDASTNNSSAIYTVENTALWTQKDKPRNSYEYIENKPLTITDDNMVDQIVFDTRTNPELIFDIYNDGGQGLTYSTFGIIHESDDLVPPTDPTGIAKWTPIDSNVAVASSAHSTKHYTDIVYSYVLLQAKRTTSGQSTTAKFSARRFN